MAVELVATGGRWLTGLCFDGGGKLFACGRDGAFGGGVAG